MAYSIVTISTKEFISMRTNLPRFQRKQTWKPVKNFKLCISVFKNYPVGVVIINKNEEGNWLLDGRQRMSALKQISNNPLEVYNWAQKFIGFKSNDPIDEIKARYWDKVNEYLQKDFEEDVYSAEPSDDEQPLNPDGANEEDLLNQHSFDPNEQRKGLNDLLSLVLMVHSINRGKSAWERNFDFRNAMKSKKLAYYKTVGGTIQFVPEVLVKTMEEILDLEKEKLSRNVVSKDTIVEFYKERYILDEKELKELKILVDQRWTELEAAFKTINRVHKILEDSKIGIIEITSATDLDAQNIFSLVNDGGTLLTAEELLSAKPFWNIKIENPSSEVKKYTSSLYSKLQIIEPDNVVRWDLCATLISRIDKNGFIFDKRNKESLSSQTTLGFKLFSALFIEGISSASVSEIERRTTINWDTDFEVLVGDLNNLCDIIGDHKYFKCMRAWGQSVMGLTSNTIALEFLTILYKSWCEADKPLVDCSATKTLKRNAVILLDKLIYEYSTKAWRGSSDSKLASDLNNIKDRFVAKSQSDWLDLLKVMSTGRINDQVVTQSLVRPILFHGKFLSEEYPSLNDPEVAYDLDHIYPKALFNGNTTVVQDYKDCLGNLEILSSVANKAKNDKKLIEIFDESIKNEISKSSGISIQDFPKYSDVSNIEKLIKKRLEDISKIYKTDRDSIISN